MDGVGDHPEHPDHHDQSSSLFEDLGVRRHIAAAQDTRASHLTQKYFSIILNSMEILTLPLAF